MMEPTSESDEMLDVVKVKDEVMSDEEQHNIPTITEGLEDEEGEENSETESPSKKYSCPVCQKGYNFETELLTHFRYECEQSATISSAIIGNGLPSLTNNEPPAAAAGISSKSPPRPISPPKINNNHHERNYQFHGMPQKQMPKLFENHHAKTDMSGRLQSPILLPITVHSEDLYSIRVIGPPQYVIPVAVGQKTDLLVSSLHIDPRLVESISLPSSLPISNGIPNFSIPIHSITSQISSNISTAPPPIKRPRLSTDSRPLDLSLKVPKPKLLSQPSSLLPSNFLSLASTLNSQLNSNSIPSKLPQQQPPPEQRKYKCACGVEFTNEAVFIGHKNYYCRLRPQSEEENQQRQPIQKFPEQCPHCNFRPSSSSNLNQHVREQHAAVKAYICSKCAYRGLSSRGIKAHLSSHHSIDDHEKYILEDRGNTKFYPCPQCHHVFISQEKLLAHHCSKNS